MIKSFWITVGVLVMMVAGVAVHYASVDKAKAQSALTLVASLVQFAEPSQSVSWYASRRLYLAGHSASNPIYPEMQSMQRMDFVYGK